MIVIDTMIKLVDVRYIKPYFNFKWKTMLCINSIHLFDVF